MLISIINVSAPEPEKTWSKIEVTYKDSYGKVNSKAIRSFTGGVYTSLQALKSGDQVEVTQVKNAKGYLDWTAVGPPGSGQPEAAAAPAASKANPAPAGRSNTFETPEERAKKQVYIVRQSSISAAIGALSVGAKGALDAQAVIDYAKKLEAFVFDTGVAKAAADEIAIHEIEDDIPL
jgi:hypothetical protein